MYDRQECGGDGVDKEYQSAVGLLLYLSGWTRPDVSFAVNNVSKFTSCPSKEHWIAVKRIMRYIKGTLHHGIRYTRNNSDLVGYLDASWAGDLDDWRSLLRCIFMLNRSPICWRSKKQTTVSLSTAEEEYMALSAAAQELMWLK